MQKKSTSFQGETSIAQEHTQQQSSVQKRQSKAYYKLLHTYNTLTSPTKAEPISISSCATPIIAERLFHCKLNQKPEMSSRIQEYLKSQQAKRTANLQEIKKQEILRQANDQQNSLEDQDDEGFQIGEKDEIDQVVQMGAKYIGGLMKGFLPGLGLHKFNNKK